ncbi:MAG TPA: thiamine phosphate synthase, partial [Acidocella sp.]|nr:thiamine phosphate synthase [Acidocella sp.]
FTDEARLPDPLPVIAQLPRGLCGVVFRHDGAANRLMLGRQVAALCRARRLELVVAGDARLAARLQAGLHLRGGRRGLLQLPRIVTSSAHAPEELLRARRAGARLIFISPVFVTKSHIGGKVLGGAGWRRLARLAGQTSSAALGGITGQRLRALGPGCAAAGAIEAFFPRL